MKGLVWYLDLRVYYPTSFIGSMYVVNAIFVTMLCKQAVLCVLNGAKWEKVLTWLQSRDP